MHSIDSQMPLVRASEDAFVEGVTFCGTVTSLDSRKVYSGCIFEGVRWVGVNVDNVKFIGCSFVENVFDDVHLSNSIFQEVDFDGGVEFSGCRIDGNVFSGVVGAFLRLRSCHVFSNTWHDVVVDGLDFCGSFSQMNAWTESQLRDIRIVDCQVRDESFAELVCDSIGFIRSSLIRFMVGGLVAADASFKQCAGEMVRFFKSNLECLALHDVEISQLSMTDCQLGAFSLQGGQAPLMMLQDSRVKKLNARNASFDKLLLDGSMVGELEMESCAVRGGSLRGARVGLFKANNCSWDDLDATDFVHEASNFNAVRVGRSKFPGHDRRSWPGVEFNKTDFSVGMSEAEIKWLREFNNKNPELAC